MRIFITGHRGQLGRALYQRLEGAHTLAGGDVPSWDMTDFQQVFEALRDFAPDTVIHAAALTQVDYCAEHPREAVMVNGVGTYFVALACRRIGARMVAISTNEVFDGLASHPYQEYDPCHPANPYGYSKFVAERVVERLVPEHMIVRTAWLYAPGGTNFIHKIVERARASQPLRVVVDEIGSPTYAPDLANALAALIELNNPGIYHLVNHGLCSRYEFATEALRLADIHAAIEPITSDAFERSSTPPRYSPLENIFAAAMGVSLRPWQDALADYILQLSHPS